jgi:hypothetical protein
MSQRSSLLPGVRARLDYGAHRGHPKGASSCRILAFGLQASSRVVSARPVGGSCARTIGHGSGNWPGRRTAHGPDVRGPRGTRGGSARSTLTWSGRAREGEAGERPLERADRPEEGQAEKRAEVRGLRVARSPGSLRSPARSRPCSLRGPFRDRSRAGRLLRLARMRPVVVPQPVRVPPQMRLRSHRAKPAWSLADLGCSLLELGPLVCVL